MRWSGAIINTRPASLYTCQQDARLVIREHRGVCAVQRLLTCYYSYCVVRTVIRVNVSSSVLQAHFYIFHTFLHWLSWSMPASLVEPHTFFSFLCCGVYVITVSEELVITVLW